MSQLESPNDPHLPDLDSLDDCPESSTPLELYEELMACGEMILTIPAEEEDRLRKGLASAKAKQNAKLKDAGIQPESTVLTFESVPSLDHEGAVQIKITLAKRSGITILRKEYPDNEF